MDFVEKAAKHMVGKKGAPPLDNELKKTIHRNALKEAKESLCVAHGRQDSTGNSRRSLAVSLLHNELEKVAKRKRKYVRLNMKDSVVKLDKTIEKRLKEHVRTTNRKRDKKRNYWHETAQGFSAAKKQRMTTCIDLKKLKTKKDEIDLDDFEWRDWVGSSFAKAK